MDGSRKYIEDMAVIKAFEDNREATKELVRSRDDILVYHTGNEDIVIEVKNIKGYRRIG
jgi:DNA-binding sugar fermentation-stimulating protein